MGFPKVPAGDPNGRANAWSAGRRHDGMVQRCSQRLPCTRNHQLVSFTPREPCSHRVPMLLAIRLLRTLPRSSRDRAGWERTRHWLAASLRRESAPARKSAMDHDEWRDGESWRFHDGLTGLDGETENRPSGPLDRKRHSASVPCKRGGEPRTGRAESRDEPSDGSPRKPR